MEDSYPQRSNTPMIDRNVPRPVLTGWAGSFTPEAPQSDMGTHLIARLITPPKTFGTCQPWRDNQREKEKN
jgi:hypothetical protein